MSDAVTTDRFDNINSMHHYYLSIIHQLSNYVYIMDKDCAVVTCNQAVLDWLGLEKLADLEGTFYQRLTQQQQYSTARTEKLKQDDIDALVAGRCVYDHNEAPIVCPDGKILYFKATRIPLLDEAGHVRGLMVTLSDISENKALVQEIDHLKQRLQEKTKETTTSAPSFVQGPHQAPRILMIEDNAVAQKAVQALLLQLDCKVDIAESGEKALHLFKPGKYDLIFMDIGLEDGSGYVVSKKIRQIEDGSNSPRVPIIALTGYEADVVKTDCTEYFMEGAITKPLTREQARQIIEHYIYHMDIPISGLKSSIV